MRKLSLFTVRICFILLLVSLNSCMVAEQVPVKNAGLCYMPFGAQTYAPISREQLAYTCHDFGSVVVRGKAWDEVTDLIQKSANGISFDDNVVRLRIQLPMGEPIYINQEGQMIQGERIYKLSTAAMEELTEQMEDLLRKKLPR